MCVESPAKHEATSHSWPAGRKNTPPLECAVRAFVDVIGNIHRTGHDAKPSSCRTGHAAFRRTDVPAVSMQRPTTSPILRWTHEYWPEIDPGYDGYLLFQKPVSVASARPIACRHSKCIAIKSQTEGSFKHRLQADYNVRVRAQDHFRCTRNTADLQCGRRHAFRPRLRDPTINGLVS